MGIQRLESMSTNTLNAPLSVKGLSNVLSPARQSFARSTNAGQVNGNQVALNVLRLEQGAFHKAPFIEEATTNLVPNSGFNTVTGTAQVFADALTSYTGSTVPAPWTLQNGSFTFGASGAISGANGSTIYAGNSNWKPLTGSGGQTLAITAQATFTTPATLSANNNGALYFIQTPSQNLYEIWINNAGFDMGKFNNGTYAGLASVTQTISASTTYTMTLSLDNTGHLTAKLYSGQGTGGTLLQTLTATDTSLTGGFLIGVGGDTGVIVSHAQVNAPFADGWTIGGDSRVAWALTSNAINGAYSANGAGYSGTTGGWVSTPNITPFSSNTSYMVSLYATTNGVGSQGAYGSVHDFNSSGADIVPYVKTAILTGTNSTPQRIAGQITTGVNTDHGIVTAGIFDSGSATFDMVQLEQKAYATTYIENNNATAGSTATRNADSLSYTLDKPLASRWFGASMYIPQQGSSSASSKQYRDILQIEANDFTGRFGIDYNSSTGNMEFGKSIDGTTYTTFNIPVTFNANDRIFIAIENDPANNIFEGWLSVNGGSLLYGSVTSSTVVSDATTGYLGTGHYSGYEANGTIECIVHELATGETITTEQVEELFAASDWSLGDYNYTSSFQHFIDFHEGFASEGDMNIYSPSGINQWSHAQYFHSKDSAGADTYVYVQCDPTGHLYIGNKSGGSILTVDQTGNANFIGTVSQNNGQAITSSASGTWTPASGSLNVPVGTVINVASIPSGAKSFIAGYGISWMGVMSGTTTPSGTLWSYIYYNGSWNFGTNTASISSTTINGIGVSIMSIHDGSYGREGYFQVNNGYLQFVVTVNGSNLTGAAPLYWGVS